MLVTAVSDLKLKARGDLTVDSHHTVEDIGLALGQAFNEALGDRAGVARMADRTVPLDEALVQVAVDLSGRPYGEIGLSFRGGAVGELPTQMVPAPLAVVRTRGPDHVARAATRGR